MTNRRKTLLLAGASGLALAEIPAHSDASHARKNNKKNQHKKCNKQCDKGCSILQTDVDLCKNECQIAKKQCKKTC